MATYELEFYEDEAGDKPVRRWIMEELTRAQRFDLGQALREQLQEKGVGVCASAYGKQLGKGLFEFRLRRDGSPAVPFGQRRGGEAKLLLRVFCHAYGDKVVLLLGGYDKGADPSHRRQNEEIALARGRLADWRRRHARASPDNSRTILLQRAIPRLRRVCSLLLPATYRSGTTRQSSLRLPASAAVSRVSRRPAVNNPG